MKTETVKKRYDRFSVFYDFIGYPVERLFFDKWRRRIIPEYKGKILEIGVGTGKNLPYYSRSAKITGVEVSQGMLNKAIKRSNALKRNHSLLLMDAQNLRLKDNSFDNVICTFVLCSVPDPVKTLREMERVCRLNGKVVMIEHVLSRNRFIAFLQRLHNPFTRYLFGFNVNRDTMANIRKAGLSVIKEENLALNDVFKFIVCKKRSR